jgi:uncharacterized protein YbjQ (UPF0145 family)
VGHFYTSTAASIIAMLQRICLVLGGVHISHVAAQHVAQHIFESFQDGVGSICRSYKCLAGGDYIGTN